ncbi:dipeptide epimerase [Fodinibius sp.]|uniref:dipeptide epimerase n=1 Tax=Fodinibius sp. TaxID=1872440 RepID=UPI002ACDBBAF|nr:dipeptide epimerase [Fodinibius sp.]MDZ7658563.1 dipeptide epimerase [Fodinibius sp.]
MPHFKLEFEKLELLPSHPFTIARGTKKTVSNVLVTLSADGVTGFGEAGPNSRYDENADVVCEAIEQLPEIFFDDIESADELSEGLEQTSIKSVQSAKSALEMAWLDWWGKNQGQPLWKLWDAPSQTTPPTSFTIGLDDIDVMQQKVEGAKDYPILKVKLGTDQDEEIIKGIREVSHQIIRVDANEGWEDLATAKEAIRFLADKNVEFIEQPMPASCKKELAQLKEWSPLPIIADESFVGREYMDEIADQFDGINIKLQKVGSLVEASTLIEKARERNLEVMIGCMIESSLGISAGALLGTWADYVDLDGHLLISNDPFSGLTLTDEKRIRMSDSAGLGVSRN